MDANCGSSTGTKLTQQKLPDRAVILSTARAQRVASLRAEVDVISCGWQNAVRDRGRGDPSTFRKRETTRWRGLQSWA